MKIPMTSNATRIPERLREIDAELRVVFDTETQQYEVWGRDISGPYLLVRYAELDTRVVWAIQRAYQIARSTGQPYKVMLRNQTAHNRRLAEQHRRELGDAFRGLSEDLSPLFRRLWPGWSVC